MKRVVRKGIFLISMIMLLFQVLSVSASEKDRMPDLEIGRTGRLSSVLSYEGENGETIYIEGVTLEIFQIAALQVRGGSAEYGLTDSFLESGITVNGMTASESNHAAKSLKALVLEKELKGQAAVTDENGRVVFQNLEPGMYLVMQTANADTVPKYTEMDPFLISVPFPETTSGENIWKYEVETLPKTEIGRKPTMGKIVVTKKVSIMRGEDEILLNGVNATFYVGLFKDEEGTKLYSEDSILPIHLVNGSVGTVTFTDLPEGSYYVYETLEDGTPVKAGETIDNGVVSYTCKVEGDGQQKISLDPDIQAEGKVVLNNVFADIPEGYFIDAEIEIKKSVFKGKSRVNVQDTFYAGIFTETDGEYVLNQVVQLEQNETVKAAVMLEGTEGKEAVTYWVFETDKEGNRVDTDSFAYEISGEGEVTLSPENLSDGVEIVNRIKEVPEEPDTEEPDTEEPSTNAETPKITETSRNTNETEKTTTVVKTGDDTQIFLYVILLFAAVAALGILGERKLRKRNK